MALKKMDEKEHAAYLKSRGITVSPAVSAPVKDLEAAKAALKKSQAENAALKAELEKANDKIEKLSKK